LRRTTSFPFTTTDETIIKDLIGRVALAISHARLYQDLETSLNKEQTIRNQLVQTEKYTAMGRMVASVTHELNNPLQTIKNCLYLLESDMKPDVSHEFLTLASSEVQRLTDLVDQLREVYRPQNNTQKATCELKQVFINISLNAIEAMQPLGGVIRTSFSESNDGKLVGVSIHDNGPGISAEHLSHIFEPLYTTKEKGLGLGLSISYDIVHKHGGQITVESLPGQGTRFTVWLPQNRIDPNKPGLEAN
jgi:signal transduction histidine kinase